MERLTIYPKDIMRVTGRSERYGCNLIQKIKAHQKKEPHQVITVEEFCSYLGLKQDSVASQMVQ